MQRAFRPQRAGGMLRAMHAPAAPTLDTPRLRLEPLAEAHLDALHDVLDDPALHTFTGGVPLGRDALRARIARLIVGRSADGREVWLNLIVRRRADDAVLGYVQATIAAPGPGDVTTPTTTAWVIGTRFQRHGYAREAAGALCTWLLAEIGRAHV